MEDIDSLGKFIAARRKILRMTQVELANQIGVSKSAIAKWEVDGGLPDRDNLKKLAKEINVSVDEMHKVIDHVDTKITDSEVNITPEVIATLESYGYKVIKPEREV